MIYRYFLRPVLFSFSPENAHKILFKFLKLISFLPFISYLIRKLYRVDNPKLIKYLFGLRFENPVGVAAGLDKNAEVFDHFFDFGFSFIEIGTVTPKAQPGNHKPRLFRLKKDMALINRMGFNNHGVETVVSRLKKNNRRIIVGGNIGKNTSTPNDVAYNDYLVCIEGLYDFVDYIAVNISCPNIGNLNELQEEENLDQLLSLLSSFRNSKPVFKPILLKISPDITPEQIDYTLNLINKYQIDGIIATNTTTTRDNLSTSAEIITSIGKGGLSGVPLREKSTEIIRYIHNKTEGKLPIIGVGGINSVSDAIEKLNAGASLIQLYTGLIYQGPELITKINKNLL